MRSPEEDGRLVAGRGPARDSGGGAGVHLWRRADGEKGGLGLGFSESYSLGIDGLGLVPPIYIFP